jgi:hypothetical protein
MKLTPRPPSLISDDQVDIVAVLRHALERKGFHGASLERVSLPEEPPRTACLFEATTFMECEPDRLSDLVLTLLGSAHAAGMEVVLWLHGERDGIRFRYAVLANEGSQVSSTIGPDFQRMLEAVFPGVSLASMPTGPGERATVDMLALRRRRAAGLLTGIPSERQNRPIETRLDEVLNGLAGRLFDVLVHAIPCPEHETDVAEDNLAHLAGLAHEITREQLSLSESESLSRSVAEGVSASWSRSDTKSWSASESMAHSRQSQGHPAHGVGVAAGAVIGGLIGAAVGAPTGPGAAATAAAGAKVGAVLGDAIGGPLTSAIQPPVQQTGTTGQTRGDSASEQAGGGTSSTVNESIAAQLGRSVGVERLNRQAGLIEELAELHLARVRRMRSFGAWRVWVQLATDSDGDLELLANLLTGALRGDQSHLEPLRLLRAGSSAVGALLTRATSFRPEHFQLPPHPIFPRGEQPVSLLSSDELAHWFRPPSSPIVGVDVRPAVSFGTSLPRSRASAGHIRLGPLIVGGRTVGGAPLHFASDTLLRHCFVAGTTGSGKTTTLRSLLLQLAEQGIPFLVVEPAKTEYREIFDELERRRLRPLRLTLRGGSSDNDRPLRFNPWSVPSGAILGRHVEAMKVLLRSCFAMQESLPQLLERVIHRAYSDCGWDDFGHVVTPGDTRVFPTFTDFVATKKVGGHSLIREVVSEFHYDANVFRNLSGALTVRIESFLRGLKGQLFGSEQGEFSGMLSRPTFIELADINEPDIKRFLLSALVVRLATELEVRHHVQPSTGLRHVTVLEEAHHFLREAVGHGPSAELMRESNTLLANAFAEVRAYGEAIIVADQAPAELSTAVLRNTNLKIAHRLLYQQDCVAMGDAMGLDEAQQRQLRFLRPGECVVHGPDFGRAVQCRVDQAETGGR